MSRTFFLKRSFSPSRGSQEKEICGVLGSGSEALPGTDHHRCILAALYPQVMNPRIQASSLYYCRSRQADWIEAWEGCLGSRQGPKIQLGPGLWDKKGGGACVCLLGILCFISDSTCWNLARWVTWDTNWAVSGSRRWSLVRNGLAYRDPKGVKPCYPGVFLSLRLQWTAV
jgi:hypothetical protein